MSTRERSAVYCSPASYDAEAGTQENPIVGTPVTVFGVPIGQVDDPQLAALTTKVLRVSVYLALLALIDLSTAVIADVNHAGVSMLLFCLAVVFPSCGYLGARKRSTQLLGCFCTFALINMVITVMSIVSLIIVLINLGHLERICKEEERRCYDTHTQELFTADTLAKRVHRLTIFFVIHLLISVGLTILNFLAFMWGYALFQMVRAGRHVVTRPAIPPIYSCEARGNAVVIGHPAQESVARSQYPSMTTTPFQGGDGMIKQPC